jgi:hypothetical protein
MITGASKYSDIRSYFKEQIELNNIPYRLDSEDKYYFDLVGTINLLIDQVDYEIESQKKAGATARQMSYQARQAKIKLVLIYQALQIAENHNKPAYIIKDDV